MSDKEQIEQIDVDDLHESPFNPRRTFRETGLQELAADIRVQRVLSPLLVRPRVPLLFVGTGDDNAVAGFEVVFGHRRLRASRIAGLAKVPCMVRAMTDEEAKRAQISENLAREDVHPIEEAEGFQALMKDHGVTADDLVTQTGKSRSYIYSRLTLLKACKEIRDACLAGEVGSEVALLIARLRTDKLQQKALGYIRGKGYNMRDGGARSFREVRDLLRERFTLSLKGKECMFEPANAALLPDAGACTTCPKRTGNAPEYADLLEDSKGYNGYVYRDGSPDLCTDPDCYDAKKRAHLRNCAAELQAKGKTVIEGAKARAAITADGRVTGSYVALKDVKDELVKARQAAQRDPKIVPPLVVTIQDPRTGKTVEAIKEAELVACGTRKATPKAAKKANNWEEQQRRNEEDRRKREIKAQAITTVHREILERVRTAVHAAPRDALDLQLVAAAAVRGVEHCDVALLVSLWGCQTREGLLKKVGSMSPEDVTKLLMDCALVDDVVVHAYALERKPKTLLDTAKRYGVSLEPNASQTPAQAAPTPSTAGASAKKATTAAAVKYRCPDTGATWTGRGLKPAWLRVKLDAGAALADFEVKPSELKEQKDKAGSAGNEQSDGAGVAAGELAEEGAE